MYLEVLHYYVYDPAQTWEGRARRILIRTKNKNKKSCPHAKRRGEDHAIVLGALPFARPCHRCHVHYFSLSSLAFLLPVSTLRTVACNGSWGSGGDDSDGCPHPHLPLVIIVSCPPSCCAPHFHPVSSCLWWLGVLSWCQLIPAIRRPIVHPVSRGLQQRCGHRVLSHVLSAGGVAMRQGGPYLVVITLPELSDTSYVASHLICMGRRGWVDWNSPCCWKVVVT